MSTQAAPTQFIEDDPKSNTIRLGGVAVNMRELVRQHPRFDSGYLSRILNGKSVPSVGYLRDLSSVLGMTMDGLLDAIRHRQLHPDDDSE